MTVDPLIDAAKARRIPVAVERLIGPLTTIRDIVPIGLERHLELLGVVPDIVMCPVLEREHVVRAFIAKNNLGVQWNRPKDRVSIAVLVCDECRVPRETEDAAGTHQEVYAAQKLVRIIAIFKLARVLEHVGHGGLTGRVLADQRNHFLTGTERNPCRRIVVDFQIPEIDYLIRESILSRKPRISMIDDRDPDVARQEQMQETATVFPERAVKHRVLVGLKLLAHEFEGLLDLIFECHTPPFFADNPGHSLAGPSTRRRQEYQSQPGAYAHRLGVRPARDLLADPVSGSS